MLFLLFLEMLSGPRESPPSENEMELEQTKQVVPSYHTLLLKISVWKPYLLSLFVKLRFSGGSASNLHENRRNAFFAGATKIQLLARWDIRTF